MLQLNKTQNIAIGVKSVMCRPEMAQRSSDGLIITPIIFCCMFANESAKKKKFTLEIIQRRRILCKQLIIFCGINVKNGIRLSCHS
jgi:hypothetical protein